MSEAKDPRQIVESVRQLFAERFPALVTVQFPPEGGFAGVKLPAKEDVEQEIKDHCPTRHRVSHAPDFSSIIWTDGKSYTFTPKQRVVIATLWEAMREGYHFVGATALLEAAEVRSGRLSDLFKGHEAWNKVIVQGILCGGTSDTYRLAPIGETGRGSAA